MSQSRQLAAIMFTDIVGYTALMGNDKKMLFPFLLKTLHHESKIFFVVTSKETKKGNLYSVK